ncbi:MAG: PepSY-associated TM helix domain-containing protein [Acidobacteriota bacterium]
MSTRSTAGPGTKVAKAWSSGKRRLKRLYWQIHSVCAIYTGGFLAFILITGAFAVYAPEVYDWEFRHDARVEAAAFDPGVLPDAIERATARLREETPGATAYQVRYPKSETHSIRVKFSNQDFRPKPFVPGQPWVLRTVFVHPSTGEILGEADDDRSVASFLRNVHVRIFAGTPGRNLVGLFGISLLIISFSGLLILAQFLGRRSLWLVRRSNARATNSDVHKIIGFVLIVPLLIFAVTGFWLGMQVHLMRWFDIERPGAFSREALISPQEDQTYPIDFGRAARAARAAHPRLIVQQITWSTDGERHLRVQGRTPRMVYERLSQSVVLDKNDYSVLTVVDTPNSRLGEKLFFLQEALHFGDFAGAPGKALYLVIGLLLGVLPLTGYAIQRLRSRSSLVPFWRWTALGCAYFVGLLWLLKAQGVVVASSWSTVLLLLLLAFLVRWITRWIRRLIARAKGSRKPEVRPEAT